MARPRTDIQPRILTAARARFLADGVDGASLRAIARAAGSNLGMLYYYFPSKDDLFFAVVEEVYGALLADLTRALEPGPFEERIGRLYARLAAMSDHELEVVKLIVREVIGGSPRLGRLLERFQRGHLPLVVGALADGMREGRVRSDLPPALLFMLTFAIGAVPQVVRRSAGDLPPFRDLPEPDRLARLLLDAFLRAVSPAG
jgi:TetR/AcrR family transcriptional regulator